MKLCCFSNLFMFILKTLIGNVVLKDRYEPTGIPRALYLEFNSA